MPPPSVSVVIPAYNAARTIATTLEAVFAQTRPPLEVIVVDDGSKDDTRRVLEPFSSRARLIFQPNSGVSAARNRAVDEAQGDWVAFCDADDVWHQDKLRIVAGANALRPEADVIFHDFWTIVGDELKEPRATHSKDTMFPLFLEYDVRMPDILPDNKVLSTDVPAFSQVDTWFGEAFRWLMLGNFLMPSTVAIRRRRFLEAGGFDNAFRYAEDTEFFLRLSKTTPFLWIDASLTGYRREAGTLLTGNMLPTLESATRAVLRHCVEDPDVMRADPTWVGPAVSKRFSRVAYFCLSELLTREARTHARTAVRFDPRNLRAWAILAAAMLPAPLLRIARATKGAVVQR